MSNESLSPETTFGYLSVYQSPEHGFFGGYLILSALGRPLEFHCTSPVRPSRAQEILYGPTLLPYLVGEQIGGALLAAATLTPRLILTDQPAAMARRAQIDVPIALVIMRRGFTGQEPLPLNPADTTGIASTGDDWTNLTHSSNGRFTIGNYDLRMPPGFESEQNDVVESLALLAPHVDLGEPFGRIHEAIREAQRIGARTPDAHGQAA